MTDSTYSTATPRSAQWQSRDAATTNGPREIPLYWPNRQHSRFVTTPDTTWHVQRLGTGPVVLLLHGTGSSSHTWGELLPLLAKTHDVIAIDLPGHGFSSPLPSKRMSIDLLSKALEGFLQAIDCTKLCIVGHSAGAAIALNLARRDHVDVAGVIGVNAALQPYGGALAGFFAPLAKSISKLPFLPGVVARRARNLDVVHRMLASTGSTLDDQGASYYQTLLMNSQHVAATLQMMADWKLNALIDDLDRVADRCHLLVADADEAVPPAQARVLQQRFPDVSLTTMRDVGHLAHEEQPDTVGRMISSQLSRLQV